MVKINDKVNALTKTEFVQKLSSQLLDFNQIGHYMVPKTDAEVIYLNANDYALLTLEEISELEEKYGKENILLYEPTRFMLISKIESKASDILWALNTAPKNKEEKVKIAKILLENNITNITEFKSGYWSGILDICNYLSGDGETDDFLKLLETPDEEDY